MYRRDFVRTGGLAAGALMMNLTGCSAAAGARSGRGAWAGPEDGLDDPRLRALAWASLAPSSHNTQPWQVDLGVPDRITLRVDPDRTLPEADPWARHILASQGCFLEALELSLAEQGLAARTCLFPEGYPGSGVGPAPVAHVDLTPGRSPAASPLFPYLARRVTNKRPFDARELDPETSRALTLAGNLPGLSVTWIDRRSEAFGPVADLLGRAMELEVADRARNAELARWFRFSSAERAATGDGLSILQSGTTGVARWVAETFFLDREDAADPEGDFARVGVEQARKQARSAAAFAVIGSPDDSLRSRLDSGRALLRLHLEATRLGVALQPMNQPLQDYPAQAPLREQLHRHLGLRAPGRAQLLVRLGRADAVPHTPRRAVDRFVRSV